MAVTKDQPIVTPHSLQGRTARAIYDASYENVQNPPPYNAISQHEREVYERMAAAALAVVLMEPLTG